MRTTGPTHLRQCPLKPTLIKKRRLSVSLKILIGVRACCTAAYFVNFELFIFFLSFFLQAIIISIEVTAVLIVSLLLSSSITAPNR